MEFYNKIFMNFLKDNGIALYSTFNEGKAVVIEHFNHTLKERLSKKIHSTRFSKMVIFNSGHCRWLQQYGLFINKIKMIRNIYKKLEYEREINLRNLKFKIGDVVRIYSWKSHF